MVCGQKTKVDVQKEGRRESAESGKKKRPSLGKGGGGVEWKYKRSWCVT